MRSSNAARRMTGIISVIIVVCTGMIEQAGIAGAQASYTVLHAFTLSPRGPQGSLVRGSDGALYGVTQDGGPGGVGTVFKLAPDGTGFTTLHGFNSSEGGHPVAGLLQGSDGTLYGTTLWGGAFGQGTVFKLAPDGTGFSTLHAVTGYVLAGLIQGSDGALYGTTYSGGASERGSVFKLAPDGTGFTNLYSFTGPEGYYPYAGLIQGSDGALYGTTNGSVFKLATDGTGFATLHSFTDGAQPVASLIQGSDGALYGTTFSGGTAATCPFANGCGTIFKVKRDGTGFTTLHVFADTDGTHPRASLVEGADGALYGTTSEGSAGYGTVFKLAPDGTGFVTLRSFTGADGAYPSSGLLLGSDGTLYGMTSGGGTANQGTLFKLFFDGTGFATLHSFGTEPNAPNSDLVQGSDGALYGTTSYGGSGGAGTVYKFDPEGTGFTILYSFAVADGANPQAGLLRGGDGTLYGTTYLGGASGIGTVFKLAPDGTGFQTLHSFSGTDGYLPYGRLIQGTDGGLYGTTVGGGAFTKGTVFKLAPDGMGFATLHSFTGSDGAYPSGSLVQGGDGALYGMTSGGCVNYPPRGPGGFAISCGGAVNGTVFKLAPDGTDFATLHTFIGIGSDGASPLGGLLMGNDGSFYGTTDAGGTFGSGTIFKLAANGTVFTTLYSFTGSEGSFPSAGLVQGSDGALYGTTGGGPRSFGTVFKLAPGRMGFATLHSFSGFDGAHPTGGLIQGGDGRFYGTTREGGPGGGGVVFGLQLGPLPTLILKVSQPFSLDQSTFHPGEQLALTAMVAPGTTPVTADAYVALQLPDGSLRFLQGGGSLTTAVQPFAAHWPVGPFNGQIFSHTFGGAEPTGSYTWLAAFTQPGTLNFIGPIVSAPFSFSP